jgi:arylsulfatase A-like enzyme
MLVRWTGKVKAGSESDHISAFWDILPTFADMAGIEKPENIDGISLLPTLLGKKQKQQHKYLYWEFHEQGGKIAVRMGNWKAVKRDVDKNPLAQTELYDLTRDIGETNNVASSNPDVVKEIEALMKEAHTPSEIFPFVSEKIDK